MGHSMEERISLSRSYLETLSTSELIRLGDGFGVDIPPALNRRLIIGELLEMQEDFRAGEAASSVSDDPLHDEGMDAPPSSYNETRVHILLRNPGWLFVFWDFNAEEFSMCVHRRAFEGFGIRVSFFDDASLLSARDSFNATVSASDRKRYIHIPEQDCLCRADLLVINRSEKDFVLAQSNAVAIPPAAGIDLSKSANDAVPPILSLSGIGELKRQYRRNYRQSFL